MGCDIHAYLEIKIDGGWHYFAPADLWRNYEVFSKMAGVRDFPDSPAPIALPKGLPDDASFMTRFHSNEWGEDGHSHSWLNYDEILELIDYFDNVLGYRPWGHRGEASDRKWNEFGVWIFGNTIAGFKKYPDDYPSSLEDIRLVFWFDN